MKKITDYWLPIDASDVISVVPPDDIIIESTWCGCEAVMDNRRNATWGSHAILTNNGLAFLAPQSTLPGIPTIPRYFPWEEVFAVQNLPRLGMRLEIGPFTLRLMEMPQRESRVEFEGRNEEFVARFQPILIEKKSEWIKRNSGTPDRILRKHLKAAEKMVIRMKKQEQKRLAKY